MPDDYDKRVRAVLLHCHKQTIELHARCDALDAVLAGLADRLGLSGDEIRALVKQVYDRAHQDRLELIENKFPGLAAELSSLDDSPP
jgi:hypothetical protein